MASFDCEQSDADIGYAKLVDKHVNEYERIFAENERKLNRYKNIDEVISIVDNDSDVQKTNSDEKSAQNEKHNIVSIRLAIHSKTANTYEWFCNDCDRRFASKQQFTCHTKHHKPFKCFAKQCGQRFATKQALTAHKKDSCFVNSEHCANNGSGVCSDNYIRGYYQKRRLITKERTRSKVDYRYVCLWAECGLEIYNSELAMRRHIHRSHTCAFIE